MWNKILTRGCGNPGPNRFLGSESRGPGCLRTRADLLADTQSPAAKKVVKMVSGVWSFLPLRGLATKGFLGQVWSF